MNEKDNEKNMEPTDAAEQLSVTDEVHRKVEKKAKEEEGKKKMYRRITVILLIVIIILILLLLQKCSSDVTVLNPDFPPQQTDPGLKPIPDDDDEKLDHEEGGGAVALDFADEMIIDLSDKQASLFFSNPGRSTSNIVLWVMIQDTVIAQSGLIIPGYTLEDLDLLKDAEKSLVEGVYSGKYVVYYYDTENNERALVNSELPVTIVVTP